MCMHVCVCVCVCVRRNHIFKATFQVDKVHFPLFALHVCVESNISLKVLGQSSGNNHHSSKDRCSVTDVPLMCSICSKQPCETLPVTWQVSHLQTNSNSDMIFLLRSDATSIVHISQNRWCLTFTNILAVAVQSYKRLKL